MTEGKIGRTTVYHTEKAIHIWDVATGKELRQIAPPGLLTFAPDGRSMVTVGDGILRFWDPGTGKELRRFDLGKEPPTALAFSPDRKTLALGGHATRVIDLASGKDLIKLPESPSPVSDAAFVLDGRTAVTT